MYAKIARVLVIVLGIGLGLELFFFLIRPRITEVKPEVFTCDGMQIELTNQFSKMNVPNMTGGFRSSDAAVLIGHLPEPETTLEEYVQTLSGGLSSHEAVTVTEPVQETDRGYHFAYTAKDQNGSVSYYDTYSYQSDSGIWTIQFVCQESAHASLLPSIQSWEATVILP